MNHANAAELALRAQDLVLLATCRLFRYELTSLREPGCVSLRRLLKDVLTQTLRAVELEARGPDTAAALMLADSRREAREQRVAGWLGSAALEPAEAALLDVVLYDACSALQQRVGPPPGFVQELVEIEELDALETALLDLAFANAMAEVSLSAIALPADRPLQLLARALDHDEAAVAHALRRHGALDNTFLFEPVAADARELGEYLAFNDFAWMWLGEQLSS